MGLKDRIMSIDVATDRKRSSVRGEAAQLAAEADELMAEMAEALRAVMDFGNQSHMDRRAKWAMDKAYKAKAKYKETQND